jgi:signal transduction histidine kinase
MGRELRIDLGICGLLLAIGIPPTLSSDPNFGASTWGDTVLLPALVLPILLRRRSPFAAAAGLAVACVLSAIPTFDQFRLLVAIPAALVIAYPLGRNVALQRALAGLLLLLAGMIVIGLTDSVQRDHGGVAGMIVFSFPLCIAVFAGGRLVRARDRVAAALAEQSERLRRRREETAALAVEVERTRVASELDIAARGRVRAIVELAGTGARSPTLEPEQAQDTFARIERMGRESLNEMRELLGVLRSDARARRSPRPTLAQLETLLTEARMGGRLVDLEVEGERRALPEGVELAAYRAVQHALVAICGADAAPATVVVRYQTGVLELEVRGLPVDGAGADAAMLAARERVRAQGGSFSTEGSSRERRVLTASLPFAAAHA